MPSDKDDKKTMLDLLKEVNNDREDAFKERISDLEKVCNGYEKITDKLRKELDRLQKMVQKSSQYHNEFVVQSNLVSAKRTELIVSLQVRISQLEVRLNE